jgi:hypothetical protein
MANHLSMGTKLSAESLLRRNTVSERKIARLLNNDPILWMHVITKVGFVCAVSIPSHNTPLHPDAQRDMFYKRAVLPAHR